MITAQPAAITVITAAAEIAAVALIPVPVGFITVPLEVAPRAPPITIFENVKAVSPVEIVVTTIFPPEIVYFKSNFASSADASLLISLYASVGSFERSLVFTISSPYFVATVFTVDFTSATSASEI